jgi:hypothetical protein
MATSGSNFLPRDRPSFSGTFSVNGPSLVTEGQQEFILVNLADDSRLSQEESVCIDPGEPFKARSGGQLVPSVEIRLRRGGNATVGLVTEGKTPEALATRYAYTSTITVNLPNYGDSAAVLVCVRRTVVAVLLASIKQANIVMKAVGSALVLAAILSLLGLVLGNGGKQIAAAIVFAFIALAFFAWFLVNTAGRNDRIRAEVENCDQRERRVIHG